jgi:hypothetical protein
MIDSLMQSPLEEIILVVVALGVLFFCMVAVGRSTQRRPPSS